MSNKTSDYTKGPWYAVTVECFDIIDFNGGTISRVATSHTQGTREYEEIAANADLMAAAPEMLEILKKCLKDELNRRKKLLNKSTAACYADERIEKMKRAIDKAEGIDK